MKAIYFLMYCIVLEAIIVCRVCRVGAGLVRCCPTRPRDMTRPGPYTSLFCCPPSCLLFVYMLLSSSFVGRAMWMDGGGRGRGRGGGGSGGWKRNALMSWQIVVPFSAALLTLSYGYHFEKNTPVPVPVPN